MKPIIVIGGGLMGLGIAWRCAAAGRDVVLFDARECARESSWAAAGMLAPFAELEPHEHEMLALGVKSQQIWPEFVAELEAATKMSVGHDRTGTLLVATDRDELEALGRDVAIKRAHGVEVEDLDPRACHALEPLLSPRITGGFRSPGDHQVDNRALATALRLAAQGAGARIVENSRVAAVLSSSGAVSGVRLESGETVDAESVVVAAGAWSRGIDGLQPFRPPVRPVKGQMLAVRFDPANPPLRHVVRNPYAYLVPKADGRLIVGATSEEQGFDRRVMAGAVLDILKGAFDVLPVIYELELIETWSGFRPGSRDNQPMLGGCDVSGLFFATGHYRNGIQQAPVTINEVSHMVLGEQASALMRHFSIDRFVRAS